MSNIIKIGGVRGFIDENGVAQLNAEDVARGWGFVQKQVKNGKTYESVRWERVNDYLKEFGFPPLVGENSQQVSKDDFLPENMVYRLGFKASNETAQAFQAKLADEILPTIRKTGSYSVKQAPTPRVDTSSQDRAKAMLLNARTRQAKLLMQLATQTRTDTYKEVITAKATNLLAGENLLPMPACANQKARHELGYFCKLIGKDKNWASALGRKLNAAGIKKIPGETGEYVETTGKGNNEKQVQNFEWYDDYLMPKLVELFSKNKTEG